MSIFGKSGGGITPEQLEALVSDNDLAAQLAALATASQVSANQTALVAKLDAAAAAGAVVGEVRLFNNATGVPPLGWSVTGQSVPANPMWSSSRMLALPYRPGASALAPTTSVLPSILVAVSETHNKLFTFGGVYSGLRNLAIWDLGTFAWTKSVAVPSTSQIGAMAQSGDYVYVGGGYSSSTTSAAMYRYNPLSETWTSLTRPGPMSRDWGLLPVSNNKVVVVGGVSTTAAPTTTNMLSSVQVYDPGTNTWSTRAAAPVSLSMVRAAALGGDRFLLLATTSDGAAVSSTTLLLYDYATEIWTICEAVPAGYSAPVSVAGMGDGRALVFFTNSPAGQSCALAYDPTAAVGTRFVPYEAGDSDAMRFIYPGVATGTCMRSYAGCAYTHAYVNGAGAYVPVLIRGGAEAPVSRNFYAIKN